MGTDEATGQTYYYNEQTGAAQWEPPEAAAAVHGAAVTWWLAPAAGSQNEYLVRNGQEQTLGRYDMLSQNPYISRVQCVVRVAADGTASLASTGKTPTALRAPGGAWWSDLRRDQTHQLADGEQIALDSKNPEGAYGTVYTVFCQEDARGQQGDYYAQPGAYPGQPPGGYFEGGQYGQQGGYGEKQGYY